MTTLIENPAAHFAEIDLSGQIARYYAAGGQAIADPRQATADQLPLLHLCFRLYKELLDNFGTIEEPLHLFLAMRPPILYIHERWMDGNFAYYWKSPSLDATRHANVLYDIVRHYPEDSTHFLEWARCAIAYVGKMDLLDLLVARGIELSHYMYSAAVKGDQIDVVDRLAALGVPVDETDFSLYANAQSLAMMHRLTMYGANAKLGYPLEHAIKAGRPDLAEYLLDIGAECTGCDGIFALAVQNQMTLAILRRLVALGADPRREHMGFTALELARAIPSTEYAETLEFLEAQGCTARDNLPEVLAHMPRAAFGVARFRRTQPIAYDDYYEEEYDYYWGFEEGFGGDYDGFLFADAEDIDAEDADA